MKKILLVGGTGIVGSATAGVAHEAGHEIHTVGLDHNPDLPKEVVQHVCDRKDADADNRVRELNEKVGCWDIVFDVIGSSASDARWTIEMFGALARRIIFLSTVLVYSRREPTSEPIRSSHPLAALGELGGYVDKKLLMEEEIKRHKDVPWTILRPYHILGPGSLLGCVPDHNRDPQLVRRILAGEALTLCEGGKIPFNIVNPADIGRVALAAAESPAAVRKAFNCCNPAPVTALDYYREVARQLDKDLKVTPKTIQQIWAEQKGWELTTLPHLYDTSDLKEKVGFVPATRYQECIADALQNPPPESDELPAVHRRMTAGDRPKPIPWLLKK